MTAIDVNNDETLLGTIIDPYKSYPSVTVPANINVAKIKISVDGNNKQLGLSSIGILHGCDCSQTSFNRNIYPANSPNSLDLSTTFPYNETPTISDFEPIDTISKACSIEPYYCGVPTVMFFEDGVEKSYIYYNFDDALIYVEPD